MAEREYIEIITSTSGEEKVDKLGKKIDDLGNEAKETGKEVDNLGDKFKQTGTGTVSLKDKIKQLTEHFKVLGKESNNSSVTLTNTVKKYVGIAAIGVGIKKATTVFTAFDDEIRKVQATSGATAEQMNNLRNQAKELGRTTRWSASEAAEAQFEFAKAGFEANEIYNATPGILNTATAGQLSLAEATEITAGTLRMFKLNADQSKRVGDALAMTANSSTTDIRGLGESLKYAGLGATDFGMSLEQTLAVLGTLGNNKIDSSMAGTGLRAVFSTLKDKNKIKLLTDLDIQLTENGEYRNFLKILDDIKVKTSGMEKAQRLSYLDQVFGREGGLVISALFKTDQKDFDELLKKIEDSKGYSQKVAEIYDGGLGGSFKNLSSAIEGVSISFIEVLAPTFITVTNIATSAINTFTRFFEWLNSGTTIANTLMFAIAGITTALATYKGTLLAVNLATLIVGKSTLFLSWAKGTLAAAYGIAQLAGGGFAGILGLINVLMIPTAGIIGIVVGAVAGLGAGFYFLYKKSETFRNGVTALINKLKELWGWIKKVPVLGIVAGVGEGVVTGIKDFFGFGKKKNKTLQETAQTETQKTNATNGNIPQTVGENTDYLLLNGGATQSAESYKHNGYYLKGSKVINNSSSSSSNIYSEYNTSENKVPEKTIEEKIFDTLLSIKDLLSSKNSESSRVQINVSKNDKEEIISQVVEDLTIALGNM